ncbi:hypothetical protein NL676_029987 [Syzygium grande]|nr:hypothetical protein NL676_029987 [Syzygium grande]
MYSTGSPSWRKISTRPATATPSRRALGSSRFAFRGAPPLTPHSSTLCTRPSLISPPCLASPRLTPPHPNVLFFFFYKLVALVSVVAVVFAEDLPLRNHISRGF